MRGIVVYTGLRLALLLAVWLIIQVVTPMRGLLAIAVALVISGIVSFIVLDRSRDQASAGLSGVFGRINDRIEQSRTAEDWDEVPSSGQGDARAEQDAVGEHEQPRALEDRHEVPTGRTSDDGGEGPHGEHGSQHPEPGESETTSGG